MHTEVMYCRRIQVTIVRLYFRTVKTPYGQLILIQEGTHAGKAVREVYQHACEQADLLPILLLVLLFIYLYYYFSLTVAVGDTEIFKSLCDKAVEEATEITDSHVSTVFVSRV